MATEGLVPAGRAGTSGMRVFLGLLLLAQAALCCLAALVVPTIRTISLSFQNTNLLRPAEAVGAANYARLFGDRVFTEALGFTFAIVVVRLLVVAIVPLLLAVLVNEFGWRVRVPVRLLFTIPLLLFAPAASALAWKLALHPDFGLLGSQDTAVLLADPARARSTILLIDGLVTFGLACGLGLLFYLAALRGPGAQAPTSGSITRPLIATWVIGLLATAALALQTFTTSFVMTRGGPANQTMTLMLYQYMQGFVQFRFGPAAVIATLTLVLAGVLGLIAGLIVILSGLRLEAVPRRKPVGLFGETAGGKVVAGVLLTLVLLGSLGVAGLGIWPISWAGLSSLRGDSAILSDPTAPSPATSLDAYRRLAETVPLARAQQNTVLPSLMAVLLIQMPLVYMAALGIGALRPLGRRSEWLLLPFSPWLFISVGPLSLVAFMNLRTLGLINTLPGLFSPILLSVPALFILTLFFKGQEPRWRAAQAEQPPRPDAFFTTMILPSLPLAGLLALALLMVEMRSLLWPLLSSSDRANFTSTVALLMVSQQFEVDFPAQMAAVVALGLPFLLAFLLAFAAFQIFYLDRLAMHTGEIGD